MSHLLIASLGVAGLVGAFPLTAHAAQDTAPFEQAPLASPPFAQDGFQILRVGDGAAHSGASMPPAISGPDFIPKWQEKALTRGQPVPTLDGDRFRFR
jgi:hypothetical protein